MDPMRSLSLVKFGIREVTAFVGHSFSEVDANLVRQITALLSKLGINCLSGTIAEPRPVKDKVTERIAGAEVFVGIFTRRDQKSDGSYSTSPWVIEEKATAIQMGKRLLLFVEEGVQNEIGGLQSDHEHIRFERENLGDALIKAIDYVLAITSVPLRCDVDFVTRRANLRLDFPPAQLNSEIASLRRIKESRPNDPGVVLQLAELLDKTQRPSEAMNELHALIRVHPGLAEAHHRIAHLLEKAGKIDDAIESFQVALDKDTGQFQFYRCFGRCLYAKAKTLTEKKTRLPLLEKAKRLFERAGVVGGEQRSKEVNADVFLVDEALAECGVLGLRKPAPSETPHSLLSKAKPKPNRAQRRQLAKQEQSLRPKSR